jgi:hypothetical protein
VIERIVRAIRLDWTVFREIAEDQNAMKEAAIIVAIVTFFSAVGTGIAAGSFVSFILAWLIAIVIGWVGWAIITYFVGATLFNGTADIPQMMRVLGYAMAPNLLGLLSFIPCIGPIFPILGWILALIAGILAVREAMEFETGNAIVTVLIGWAVVFVINLIPRLF